MSVKRLKVFIVSENRLLRDMLARIFEQEQGLAVVGVARLCREAIEEISSTRPDVLLLDPPALAMPDLNDLQRIRRRAPQLRVVAFGMAESEEAFLAAVRGEQRIAVTGWDGLRALELAHAVVTSGLDHRVVLFPGEFSKLAQERAEAGAFVANPGFEIHNLESKI